MAKGVAGVDSFFLKVKNGKISARGVSSMSNDSLSIPYFVLV